MAWCPVSLLVDAELCVVGLVLLEVSGGAPGLVVPVLGHPVGRGDLLVGPCPEPPVDDYGLEVRPVAAVEVTEATRGPGVGEVAWDTGVFNHTNRECGDQETDNHTIS